MGPSSSKHACLAGTHPLAMRLAEFLSAWLNAHLPDLRL